MLATPCSTGDRGRSAGCPGTVGPPTNETDVTDDRPEGPSDQTGPQGAAGSGPLPPPPRGADPWAPPAPAASTSDGASRPDGAWTPPGAPTAAWSPDAGTGHDAVAEADAPSGPPPPPTERRRRRRRRLALLTTVAVLVLGIPIGLAIASSITTGDPEPAADGEDAAGDSSTGPDGPAEDGRDDGSDPDGGSQDGDADAVEPGEVDPSMELDQPDVGAFDGLDASFAQLLVDIDASEMTMIAFQADLGGIFQGASGERALAAARTVAERRRDELLEVRGRLEEQADDADVEAVRDVYVEHLDSWERFMGAVEEDPTVLAQDGRDAIYTLDINATADAFARALEDRLPGSVDAEVRAFADAILDRGFRSAGEAEV
jgi:hypothetical protein